MGGIDYMDQYLFNRCHPARMEKHIDILFHARKVSLFIPVHIEDSAKGADIGWFTQRFNAGEEDKIYLSPILPERNILPASGSGIHESTRIIIK